MQDDGTASYFRASVADNSVGEGYVIRDSAVAQITVHFIVMVGSILDKGGYHGPVDLLCAVTGAKGATSGDLVGRHSFSETPPTVPTDDYRKQVRVPAARLLDDPCLTASLLLERLLRAVRPRGLPDPLDH